MDRLDHFIYLHIMKTAGTSVSINLKRIYKRKYLLDLSFQKARTKQDGIFRFTLNSEESYPKNYKKYSVVHGHFTYEKYQHLGWPYITFLRDPIKRVISRYFSVKNYAYEEVPLRTFCERSANEMMIMTGGDLSKFAFIGIVEQFPESLKRLGKFLGVELQNIRRNKTLNKQKLTPEEVSIIRKYNGEDMKLYNRGLKLFRRNYG